jgi:butyryl-CoA dehydrogenase
MIYNEEQRLIQDQARAFAQKRLRPTARSRDRDPIDPTPLLREMGELGFLGMTVSPSWGGAGAGFATYALALEEIAAGDGAISTIMSVQNSVVCGPIEKFGTSIQKETYLRPLAEGRAIGCFCLTEPEAGSDAAAIRTRAIRQGDNWILNGTKQFITSGSIADTAIVFAVTDPDKGKHGISAFVVQTRLPGFKPGRPEHKLGQRGSDTCAVSLEDCRVPMENMLGATGEGYKVALSNLESGRVGIAAQSVGMARAAYEAALSYARERKSFGAAIINHQAVAFRLADMATQIEAARQLVLHAATKKDSGEPALKEAAMAKLFASEMAEQVCSDAIQIHGGYGYLEEFEVARIYRDVRVCQIYEGTSDIQRMIISRNLV